MKGTLAVLLTTPSLRASIAQVRNVSFRLANTNAIRLESRRAPFAVQVMQTKAASDPVIVQNREGDSAPTKFAANAAAFLAV